MVKAVYKFFVESMLGSEVREFWRFWGSDVISSAVFPAAKTVYGSVLSQHHHCAGSGKIFYFFLQSIFLGSDYSGVF